MRFPQDRWNGYAKACVEAGIDPHSVKIRMVAVNAIGNGFAAMKALLALPKYLQPTAVLAMSDVLAHGAMQACAEDGVDIPADLAIVGFDDAPFAVEIGLSTVSQSPSDKAEIAVRYALGEDVYVTHLPARLIDRQTA